MPKQGKPRLKRVSEVRYVLIQPKEKVENHRPTRTRVPTSRNVFMIYATAQDAMLTARNPPSKVEEGYQEPPVVSIAVHKGTCDAAYSLKSTKDINHDRKEGFGYAYDRLAAAILDFEPEELASASRRRLLVSPPKVRPDFLEASGFQSKAELEAHINKLVTDVFTKEKTRKPKHK